MDLIQIAFVEFHNANPEIYRLFDMYTRALISKGYQNGSASMVIERIRWEQHITTVSNVDKPPKINNNFKSRYARCWMRRNPTHDGFFHIRELRTHSINSTRYAQ